MANAAQTGALSRRGFITAGVALGVAELTGCKTGHDRETRSPGASGVTDLSASEAIRRMKLGDMTAESYAGALLARADAEARLNAFITIDRAKVLEAARSLDKLRQSGQANGLLHGLPVAVKDVINTTSLRTTYATAALKDYVPRANAVGAAVGNPGGTVPVGKANRGLPVALQFDALSGHDRLLLAAAKVIEPVFAGAL